MHFLETYALGCGAKISRPYIFQKYFSIPFDKYITFNFNNYEYYQDVIDIISPALEKNNIKIVYFKNENGDSFDLCHEVVDIDYNQSAYVMGNSLLHFGEPTLLSDLASFYEVKTVTIYSNAFPQNVRPYWNQENDFEVKSDSSTSFTPAFNSKENYKLVNLIRPEDIAKKILTALSLEYDYEYKTVYIGDFYQRNDVVVEIVPDSNPPILMPNKNCSVRMDLKFDEKYLYEILKLRPHQIWTDKPIKREILEALQSQVQQVFYIVTDNDDASFAKTLNELSIQFKLVSYLDKESLGSKKLEYVDHDPIIDLRTRGLEEIRAFDELGINSLFYSSCKVIYDSGLYYPSEYARKNMMAIDEPFKACRFEESDVLLKDLPFFKILHKSG